MSIKSKVLATAATLALVGGVGTAGVLGAGAANAATPSCGNFCLDVFSPLFGTYGHSQSGFTMDVWRQHIKIGQPIILFRSSQYDPAEDFQAEYDGLVSNFASAGLVSANVALHYGGGANCAPLTSSQPCADDPAFEIEYSPYGVDSGLCVGLASTASQEEGVTLQNCGVSSKTVWIADIGFYPASPATVTDTEYTFCPGTDTSGEDCHSFNVQKSVGPSSPAASCLGYLGIGDTGSGADDPQACFFGYFPLINGSDENFSHPFVLSYPTSGYPTDMPRPELQVTNLTGFSNGYGPIVGNVDENQLWGIDFGVLY
jgi:hypothetical protein